MGTRLGLLIDDRGQAWSDDAPELYRRLGCQAAGFDLAGYAVRNLGFVHLRPHSCGMRVDLRASCFTTESLITTLYAIADRQPPRILLASFTGEQWRYEICSDIGFFTKRAQALAAGEPVRSKRLFAFDLDAKALRSSRYRAVRPMLKHWRSARGRMDEGFDAIFNETFFQERATLVRSVGRESRFVFEHFGAGIKTMTPDELMQLKGRDICDVHDREYGAWVAESFAEAAFGQRPRVAAIRAAIKTSEGLTVLGTYSRVLLPWRRGADETFVLGISVLRERSIVR